MFRRMAALWMLACSIMAGSTAKAQMPFPVDLIPKRTSLERLGLERQWFGVVPLVETERVLRISLANDYLFAQTSYAMVHAFDAETGRYIWSAQLGERTGFARGVAANSYMVVVTNADNFYAIDKKTGRRIWKYDLGNIPTSSPACDEDRAMVGLTTGKLFGFELKQKDKAGNEHIVTVPQPAWNWQTGGPMFTRPLPTQHVILFGSSDGMAYASVAYERTSLYRFSTGGPIGEGLASYGTRMLLIPSADNNLYALDVLSAKVYWTFPSGAPIEQEPLVADEDIYITNKVGYLTHLDPSTGQPRWTTSTQGGRLAAISPTKLYSRSYNRDLFLIDRKTGRTLVDPGETHVRAGLNLREYNLDIVNRFNDRMYFATSSGMIICLREESLPVPHLLKDPKALPFGYIPPEGIKETPPPTPAAQPAEETKGEPAAGEDAEKEKTKPAAEKDQETEKEKDVPAPEKKDVPAPEKKDVPAPEKKDVPAPEKKDESRS
jgi:outer membrane protein assembly factor BamB